MTQHPPEDKGGAPAEERIPLMQRLYDNVWLLFILSLISVFGFYLVWGFIDLVNVPRLP